MERLNSLLTLVKTSVAKNKQGRSLNQYVCECGTYKKALPSAVKNKGVRSCGCLKKLRAQKHGMCKSPEYNVWHGMHTRCGNSQAISYATYGARGITVCPEWKSFERFFADMGKRPTPEHSIERLDNNSGYTKENCVWATREVQAKNKQNTVRWLYQGNLKTVCEWANVMGILPRTLRSRVSLLGWSIEDALTIPTRKRK